MKGKLYLVATPIGNLGDISLRALETLRIADVVACEDTRHSQKLFNHHGLTGRLVSYHEHNEAARAAELVARMTSGESVALISDAGTPAISDPGFRLVRQAIEAGIDIVPVPGPAAFVAAAIASGLPTDSLFFGGFLPARSGERKRRLRECAAIPATLIFYEAPHRLAAALADCAAELGPRPAAVVRELTKLHEEILRGDLAQLAAAAAGKGLKGEIVIVIDRGVPPNAAAIGEASIASLVAGYEKSGLDRRDALKHAARDLGLSRSEAYRRLHSERIFESSGD
ncbi:MAG: 16S rRNA (cytidine(1402)-2'-O)-methyltransferase [Pyrinomonadaceae bacterium]